MKVIYLDGCATTRIDDEVLGAMLPFLQDEFGNPSSQHVLGKRARRAVDTATESVAALIGADPGSLVFTSGATESNNLALLGAYAHDDHAPVNGLFCPTDHKSSLAVGHALSQRGIETRMMRVAPDGQVDRAHLAERLDSRSRTATVAWVNSEIGTVQPVAELAAICHAAGAMLHVDGVQAAGRIPIDVKESGIDTLSLSGHKIRGPKGVGALYVRPDVRDRIRPVMYGGGQFALRSGTIATHLVVGLGKACELALARLKADNRRAAELRIAALEMLVSGLPGTHVNGPLDGVPHILNVRLPDVRGESLVSSLSSVAVATGSACNSASQDPSPVLTAIGLSAEEANSSIRICIDPRMPERDLTTAIGIIVDRARGLAEVAVAG